MVNGRPGDPRSFDRLDALLEAQAYRLPTGGRPPTRSTTAASSTSTSWRRSAWRTRRSSTRPTGCCSTWSARARSPGCGSTTPTACSIRRLLRQLQERIGAHAGARRGRGDGPARPFYLVVEKILGADEPLPDDWPVHGTTGYDFLNLVNGLFVDRAQRGRLRRIYTRVHRAATSVRRRSSTACKKLIMATSMASELNVLAHALNRISEQRPALARLHAEQPARGAARGDRLLPRLPHLRQRRRGIDERGPASTSRPRSREARRRNPALERDDLRLPPRACCCRDALAPG